jgi:hypothetical protein
MAFDQQQIERAFRLLEHHLARLQAGPFRLVVCGGSALIGAELVTRTTKDVDVVALMDGDESLVDPEPLPPDLLRAAAAVAQELDLPSDWLNNGPSSGNGGLFRMGLPSGLAKRVSVHSFGEFLTVCFVSRFDQIFFKLYAAVDRGGYHTADLLALKPSTDELLAAAQWTMTHDVSDGFRMVLTSFLRETGYESVAEQL